MPWVKDDFQEMTEVDQRQCVREKAESWWVIILFQLHWTWIYWHPWRHLKTHSKNAMDSPFESEKLSEAHSNRWEPEVTIIISTFERQKQSSQEERAT